MFAALSFYIFIGMKTQLNEVQKLQKIAGILKENSHLDKGYDKMGEESQMEADTSWKSLPREMAGKYQVKIGWRNNKEHFMDAINAFKKKLGDVKFDGKFRKGNPNSPNRGVVTITGDSTSDIINFLVSNRGMSEKKAKEYMDKFGELRSDLYR